jgi:hypothetical protein
VALVCLIDATSKRSMKEILADGRYVGHIEDHSSYGKQKKKISINMPAAKTGDPIVIKKKNRMRKVLLFPVAELATIECTCWTCTRYAEMKACHYR